MLPTSRFSVRSGSRRARQVLSLLLVGTSALAAQGPSTTPPVQTNDAMPSRTDPRPVADAVARSGPVSIDGRLDDAAWAAATPVSRFIQSAPDEGKAPSERTELRFLFDGSAVYVGARMYDAQGAAGVRTRLARRDQLLNDNGSDKIALVFDPYRDRSTRVWFELNPLGVKGEHYNGDDSYDPVWEGAATVDSLGWTAEFRIPLSQLRFSRDSLQTWGMQVWRTISRRNESDMWAFWRQNEPGGPPYFGTLQGIAVASQPRQMEIVPYVVTGQKYAYAQPGDPFGHRSTNTTRAGLDAKVLLTTSLTLDATVNPDFGQVEVDPATVNLSAFETFFQEKRPFFVANSNAFSFGSFKCFFCSNVSNLGVFYSRRIGRAPQLTGAVGGGADYVDAPDASTILGAAKITGRTKSGWTVGILDALTNKESARYVPAGSPPSLGSSGFRNATVEPLTNYFMGRLRKDLNGGNTRIGGITTLTARALGDDPLQRGLLRQNAELLGGDLSHYWHGRAYALDASMAVSNVGGDTSAIRRTQQSSAHYFQRPGRTVGSDGLFGASYDPRRTSLQGYGLYAHLAKESGDWRWETAQNWRSPGFEVNDIAFLNRADYKWMNANVVRQWTRPGTWYRSIFTVAGAQQQYNYDGDRTDVDEHLFGQVTLPNYYNVSAFVIHHPRVYDDRLTRGGPTVIRTGYDFFSANVGSDDRKALVGGVNASVARSIGTDGYSVQLNPSLSVRPSPRMLLSLGPSYARDVTERQYVTSVSDPTNTAFSGRRYVFGTLDQRTVALETRLNTTFTPTLTLELYAQPFLASGHYAAFKEYTRPRVVDVVTYGRDAGTIQSQTGEGGAVTSYRIDPDGTGPASAFTVGNPNFNVRSLRGTAVMRWEYRPGATLFAVWTQSRDGSAAFGDFDFGRERSALFRERPTNIFQVKVNYWIGR